MAAANSTTCRPGAPTPRILVVADGERSGRGVAERLGADLAGGVPPRDRPGARRRRPRRDARRGRRCSAWRRWPRARSRARCCAPVATPELPIVVALCATARARRRGAPRAAKACSTTTCQHCLRPGRPGSSRDQRSPRACRLARPAVRARGRRRERPIVLLVEDDEFSHQLVAITLEPRRRARLRERRRRGARTHPRGRPDLVLMDVILPGRDGVELTQRLKADPDARRRSPSSCSPAKRGARSLVRSMEAGAADFIVKPFTRDALIAKLAKFLPAPCTESRAARRRATTSGRSDRDAAELPGDGRPGGPRIALGIEAVEQLASRAPARSPGSPA